MVGTVFALICADLVGPEGNPRIACQKALEAYTHPYQLDQKVSEAQRDAQREIEIRVGRKFAEAVTVAYIVGVKKELTFSTRKLPIAHRTTVRVNPDTAGLYLGWSF